MRPSEAHARLALREAGQLMAPIVLWLLRNGVQYGAFAEQLKQAFVQVARAELEASGARPTHSAISVLSGVHRKDVRALGVLAADAVPAALRSVPLASQVYTRWLTDAAWRDAQGRARSLPRSGPGDSFEALARLVSTDVHPRTLLDELLRLGLVQLHGDDVTPSAEAFVPTQGLDELAALFSANAADHLAAAVHNLTLTGPKFLEQSVFADGLAPESAQALAATARRLWAQSFETMVAQARRHVDADAQAGTGPRSRMRFGVYYYAEPVETKAASSGKGETRPKE